MKLPDYQIITQSSFESVDSIRVKLSLPENLDFFDGHFDSLPILPAVAQLFIAKKIAEQLMHICGQFNGLKQLKFMSPISPNSDIELQLIYAAKECKLHFEYNLSGKIKSKGVFVFSSAKLT